METVVYVWELADKCIQANAQRAGGTGALSKRRKDWAKGRFEMRGSTAVQCAGGVEEGGGEEAVLVRLSGSGTRRLKLGRDS